MKHVDGRVHVAWIPSLFARRGKLIKILFGNVWQNGWQVIDTYDLIKTREDLDLMRNADKDFRYVLGE